MELSPEPSRLSDDRRFQTKVRSRHGSNLECERNFDLFEKGLRSGSALPIERMLEQFPECNKAMALAELLRIELDHRVAQDHPLEIEEYKGRFPGNETVVDEVVRMLAGSLRRAEAPDVGRYEPIDVLGTGGQGEVWLMRDTILDRRVAIKVLNSKGRNNESDQLRFVREAEIGGKLEHPNIVPLYDWATSVSSGAAPASYVMRVFGDTRFHKAIEAFHGRLRPERDSRLLDALRTFERQQTTVNREELKKCLAAISLKMEAPCDSLLKSAIESILNEDSEAGTLTRAIYQLHSRPFCDLAFRRLLNRFQQVCEGVAYAHSRGVIHRDLKPDNVILGEFGETLVADWGLAKVVGRDEVHRELTNEPTLKTLNTCGDADKSLLGEVKGTPTFMSPEQAMGRNDELGPATDIYSLGAILYFIVAGKPPISPPSHEGDILRVLAQVRDGKYERPSKIRKETPRALEAIVLKAMAMDRGDRYTKASDLGADVDLWLNGAPVSAWPEPLYVRTKRWAKTHQRIVAAAFSACIVAIFTLSWMFAVVAGKNETITEALQHVSDNKEIAEAEAKRATLESRNAKMQSELALRTIEEVIYGVQESLSKFPRSSELRTELMTSMIDSLSDLSLQHIDDSNIDATRAVALISLGDAIRDLGEIRNDDLVSLKLTSSDLLDETSSAGLLAERFYEKALDTFLKQLQIEKDNAHLLSHAAICHQRISNLCSIFQDYPRALININQAIESTEKAVSIKKDDETLRAALADYIARRSTIYFSMGNTNQSLVENEKATQIYHRLVESGVESARIPLGWALVTRGMTLRSLDKPADALVAYENAIQAVLMDKTHEATNNSTRTLLAWIMHHRGIVYMQFGYYSKAKDAFQAAIAEYRSIGIASEWIRYSNLSELHGLLASANTKLGLTTEISAQLQASIDLAVRARDNDPSNPGPLSDLVDAVEQKAIYLTNNLEFAEAKETYQYAISLLDNASEQTGLWTKFRVIQRERFATALSMVIALNGSQDDFFAFNSKHPYPPQCLQAFALYGKKSAIDGRLSEAELVANFIRQNDHGTADDLYNAATIYALAISRAPQAVETDEYGDKVPTATQFESLAVETVREAVKAGFREFGLIRHGSEFASLRRSELYQELSLFFAEFTYRDIDTLLKKVDGYGDQQVEQN